MSTAQQTNSKFKNVSTAIVKLTNSCNIRCDYCYENIVSKGSNMTSSVFQDLTEKMLVFSKRKQIQFILHGGEPTLLPVEWFEKNFNYVHKLAKHHGKKVQLSIQTNLINIPDEKLKLFKKYNLSIGGSIDNPDDLPETMRPLSRKALTTFLRAQELGIDIGILGNINYSNYQTMTRFCEWLYKTLKRNDVKINIAYPVGMGINILVPKAKSIFRAQKDLIDFMIKTKGKFIEHNIAEEICRYFESFLGKEKRKKSICDNKRCGAGSTVIGVTTNGNILPCGRFRWDDQSNLLSTLKQTDEQEFFEKLDKFHNLEPQNWEHCDTCDAKSICGYGCQAFIIRSKAKKNIECEPTKLKFKYFQEKEDEILPVYKAILKRRKKRYISPLERKINYLKKLLPEENRKEILLSIIS